MQSILGSSHPQISAHTLGVRVMLLTDRPEGVTARRLASFGSLVGIAKDLDSAVETILDDPMGFDLFVMDCDAFGGIEGAEQAVARLIAGDARMRVMLVSSEFDVPVYPLGRRTAVCLPEDTSDAGFRIGFDHVLRDRAAITMM